MRRLLVARSYNLTDTMPLNLWIIPKSHLRRLDGEDHDWIRN